MQGSFIKRANRRGPTPNSDGEAVNPGGGTVDPNYWLEAQRIEDKLIAMIDSGASLEEHLCPK